MKKQIITLALVPALLFGAVTVPMPKEASAATATGQIISSVSLRQGADTNAARIRYLKPGEKVTILSKVNSWWYKVRASDGQEGYISTDSKYIETSSVTTPDGSNNNGGSNSGSASEGQIVSSVSFRQGASTDAARIRYLKAGEKVTILSKVNSYWYKVKASDGREGYVSTDSKYIKTSGVTSPGDSNNNGGTSGGSVSEKAQKVIAAGKKYLGTPYEYGSSRDNTKTFDCSDFVRQAFLDGIGLKLPSDSRGQGSYVKSLGNAKTDWHDLKPGDLMFFMDYKGTSKSAYSGVDKSKQTITHVAIYLGNGQILSTYSKESGGVRIDSFENRHWEYRFLFGGSAL
ncbi:SH3 domain-containing protein [Paenibacillus aceris]|uniref:Cell wall-associated NlpC family hydrolase n=1 Tax=Paenibacillus aceris TaxID=869555 RepID=A0ABS4I6J1_9BACL|nr:SH3 domain-containing protein [Paenibacillus aceris]MBP1966036.1 cell wall-associated NlpC family hydrolase [Paenibacillus aceris]NHW39737.1 SH3 domain-containing protein [Paenibacillus aceris]